MDEDTLGDDLEKLRATGLSSPHLFDVYGRLDRGTPPGWKTAEIRAYEGVARIALKALRAMCCLSRSGTHYRMAGAILQELQTAPDCHRCNQTGFVLIDELWKGVCPACMGSGLKPASISWRADACECRRTEFRDNTHAAYIVTIAVAAFEQRSAMAMNQAP